MPKQKGKEEKKPVIKEPSQKQDLREFTRCNICLKAEVRLANGILLEGETENISMKGLWFRTEKTFPKDTPVRVHLYLSGTMEKESLDIRGFVVRIEADGMGIRFEEIDSDSVEHLQRLLMYNAIEIDKIHQEFDEHLGLKKHDKSLTIEP
ncbi:MAG TPA: PilZ domain-containing protein [Candidatus Hydrogenedens sp.]|nr:PilZ domain-containing protein [Candidatus Hydrogenedens sp.]